jgi:rhombotail lipoprotein
MKIRTGLLLLAAALMLSGCGMFGSMLCHPNCRSEARASSSLVSFLYPSGNEPPRENTIPQLNLPLRVGLAFLPSRAGSSPTGLEAAEREKLLDRIRQRFADRKFISEITIVPDYYLSGASGFDSLQGVQRLYNVDMMALVSYDQVTYRDDNSWSLGYLTIVGAYVLKGSRHDVTTLMDLAVVVDPQSRSILLRAGGTDSRHGTTTLVEQGRETREAHLASFSAATDALIEHFDEALVQFESDVRAGKAKVSVAHRSTSNGGGGGGALDVSCLVALGLALIAGRRRAMPLAILPRPPFQKKAAAGAAQSQERPRY